MTSIEIREALATNVHLKAVTDDLEPLRVVVAAARAYVDLLEESRVVIAAARAYADLLDSWLSDETNKPGQA